MGTKNHIFVRSANDYNNLKYLYKNNEINLDGSVIVLWEDFNIFFLNNNVSNIIHFKDFSKGIDINRIRNDTLELIKTFPHKKIHEKKTLVELLEYDGYSLWWFIRQGFFGHCLRIVKEALILDRFLKNSNIKHIILLSKDDEFYSLLKALIIGLDIKIEFVTLQEIHEDRNYLEKSKELVVRFGRIFQGFLRQFNLSKNKKRILLVTLSQNWGNIYGGLKGDSFSYTIMRDLLKDGKYGVVPLDIALNKKAAYIALKEKKRPFIPYDYFIFLSFIDIRIQRRLKKLKSRLRNLWKVLNANQELSNSLVYDKIRLYEVLKKRIEGYFLDDFDSLIGAARNYEIGKKIMSKFGINLVICIDENGTSRFLVYAAHSMGVPSLAFQHGIIHPTHISYNYSRQDVDFYDNNFNCLFADRTAVFGSHFKKLLITQGNYQSKRLVVTGQTKMDFLSNDKKKVDKKQTLMKLKIHPSYKIVVFASQPLKNISELKLTLSTIIKCIRKLNKVSLVIKVHPGDDENTYYQILKELNFQATVIKRFDLYEILSVSDLILSISSTVMLEALIMGKPAIQVNLMEKHNFFGELQRTVLPQVLTDHDLYLQMKKFLLSEKFRKESKDKINKFIPEYYFKIDGKSTKRFLNIATELLK